MGLGAPADLLRRRPDIRRSERQLAAATARNTAWPLRTSTPPSPSPATIGISAANGGDLLKTGSHFFSAGPGFTWNLFQGGSIRNQIKLKEALTREALYTYQLAVINALNETDSAFRSYRHELQRLEAPQAHRHHPSAAPWSWLWTCSSRACRTSRACWTPSASSSPMTTKLAQSRGQAATNLVLLYKALGGGWQPPAQAAGGGTQGAAAAPAPEPVEGCDKE